MADIYLGKTGVEYTLPQTKWHGGAAGENPVVYNVPVEAAQTLGGTVRYNFRSNRARRWTLEFPEVTAEELREFETICAYNETLRYQNNWYSATWYSVAVSAFQYAPLTTASASADIKYNVQLTLEEVV